MNASATRPYRVEEHFGAPVYVEERTLPELTERESQINDEGVPAGKRLRAGAARVDVTPELSSNVKAIAGFLRCPPTGVHDRLHVRALVLDNGDERLAIVSWDRIHSRSFEEIANVRRAINERTGIAVENILINMTHTHAGCEGDWHNGSVQAVAQACDNMKDARIGVGSKMIYGICTSRRMPDGRGLWDANQPNPDGVMDNECGVIRVEDDERNIIAVVAKYCGHPSVMDRNNSVVSGDYAGIGTLEMEKRLGGDAVAMFLQGCAGDTGTHTFRTGRTFPEAEKLGGRLADAVLDILSHIDVTSWAPLAAKTRMIELPIKKFDKNVETLPVITEGGTTTKDEIQALIIGDAAILVLGSMEAYVEIGLMVKDGSPFRHTFPLAYSNGPWLGYLPSPHGYAVRDPDAEGKRSTHFSSEAPHVLVAETLKLAGEMKAGSG
ncbi:MAG: neutral/alkaline non-lysosomal ceramidase N-terminal domain-containing protein [Planctomycetota bacterium]|nr:neutral/alkaline non-lysosomal ceramidase N-terminal domain-containing protein [Planctomycetota bacterium]